MRRVFLFLLITLSLAPASWSQDKVNKEEEARKAAEVFGGTYTPQKPEEALIDFSETGMNDEEKEVVLSNYERTRSEYKEDPGDSLFEKISKAYVRNLDKILVKKKEN